jgi:hypothetical protein
MLLVLEQYWSTHHLACYGIAMLSKTSYHACKYASSQLEWMSDDVIKVSSFKMS